MTSSKINVATKHAIQAAEDRFAKRVDEMEKKMEQGMKALEEKIAALTNSPAPMNPDELRKLVRECLADRSLVTNTPASAIHCAPSSDLSKGIYATVEELNADLKRAETLIDR
jgi:hypothetical protein